MRRVRVSKQASAFVRREAHYYRRVNPQTALTFAQIVRRAKDTLGTFDHAGNETHGLQITGGRTLVVDNYLFDYIIENDVVYVIAVRHGRMLQVIPIVENDIDDDQRFEEQVFSSTPSS